MIAFWRIWSPIETRKVSEAHPFKIGAAASESSAQGPNTASLRSIAGPAGFSCVVDAAWWPALGDNQGAPDDGEEIDARQDQLLGIVLRHVGDLKAKLFTERLAREIEFQIVLIASEAAG